LPISSQWGRPSCLRPALSRVVFAALFLTTNCGYVGEPLPPLANVPGRVLDLSAVQRGAAISASFTLPTVTTENFPIKAPLHLDLRIGPRPDPFRESDWLATAMPLPEGPVENGIAHYSIPSAPWLGKSMVVGVRVIGANEKASAWSNFVTVPVVAPPPVPMNVSAVAVPEGVRLSWQAAGTNFRVLRRSDNEDFAPIGDATQSPYTDTSAEFGKPYTYRVVTIAKIDEEHSAESELSADVSITPKDTFPPVVPTGLRATPAPNGIELSWEGNTEADLAGYRIYRSEAGGPFERIAEAVLPAYADRMVEHGKTYRYAITSFDRTGNESARTGPAEARYE
jgi:hypothetical protein